MDPQKINGLHLPGNFLAGRGPLVKFAELESAIIPNGHTEDLRATLARKASVGEVSEGMIAELESGGKKI